MFSNEELKRIRENQMNEEQEKQRRDNEMAREHARRHSLILSYLNDFPTSARNIGLKLQRLEIKDNFKEFRFENLSFWDVERVVGEIYAWIAFNNYIVDNNGQYWLYSDCRVKPQSTLDIANDLIRGYSYNLKTDADIRNIFASALQGKRVSVTTYVDYG